MHSQLTAPENELPKTVEKLQQLEVSLHDGLLDGLNTDDQKRQFLNFRRQVEIKRRQLESLQLEQLSANFQTAAADLRGSITHLQDELIKVEERRDAIALLNSISQVAVKLAVLMPGI